MENKMPHIMTSQDLIQWCRERKKLLNLSNQKLSELSNVPLGTIDRIMSGNYTEYRYSSIQPIVGILLNHSDDIVPDNISTKEESQYLSDTIEGYKLVIDNKDHLLEKTKCELEIKIKEVDYLKDENDKKNELIKTMKEHIKWMETIIDKHINNN